MKTEGGQTSRISARHAKILVAMYKLSDGRVKMLKYEDIVVRAFEDFPEDFQLRGYPKYPDASDIHKPLYGPLKRAGLVEAANKRFKLTSRGIDFARGLVVGDTLPKGRSGATPLRLDRDAQTEINRLLRTRAFELFAADGKASVLDTDFYNFFRATPRTRPADFEGRINRTRAAIDAARKIGHAQGNKLAEVADALLERFKDLVDDKVSEAQGSRGGTR